MVALLLVAVSLGLSNFAAAVGLGVGGIDLRTRVRVGVTFGIFETGTPIAGLLLGHGLAATLGERTRRTSRRSAWCRAWVIGTVPVPPFDQQQGGA
jgi:hypothetical protein